MFLNARKNGQKRDENVFSVFPLQWESYKFKKSYDLPLDLLQYRRENSAEYLYS